MKNVISMFDVSTTLTILANSPTITLGILCFYAIFIERLRVELAAAVGGLVVATILKENFEQRFEQGFDPRKVTAQLLLLAVYHYNIHAGVVGQCVFDYIVLTPGKAKSKAILKFFMLIFMSLAQTVSGEVAACLFVVIVYAIIHQFSK